MNNDKKEVSENGILVQQNGEWEGAPNRASREEGSLGPGAFWAPTRTRESETSAFGEGGSNEWCGPRRRSETGASLEVSKIWDCLICLTASMQLKPTNKTNNAGG
ncbi:unnamed protein product [Protopolystoma xenopodis]|uniref:Uncharacterized protein n=1 Tax=Protopolystoma xenopodis TaxID=117903 RepID=A0A448XGX0_9PLAT|nr:unnamed protein product [Protopolystoma xenopodis]